MQKNQKVEFEFAGQKLKGQFLGVGYLSNGDKILRVMCGEGFIYPIRKQNIIKDE